MTTQPEEDFDEPLRSEQEIAAEYKKLFDKVWWNRHMASGEHPGGRDVARGIEDRWGKEYLDPGDDVEWGICLGKMKALAWVLGSDWDGAGDT
jgi:hypothetical protein